MPSNPQTYTVAVGTKLSFQYSADHNVYLMPSQTAANSCVFSGATMLASDSIGGGLGGYTVNLYQVVVKAKGILYFACQRGGHCDSDQRIAVTVVDAASISPPPPPPVSLPPPGGATTGSSAPCFPSHALVTKSDGTAARIGALKEGDAIVAATTDGRLTTDVVTLLSISKPGASATFTTLTTSANTTLTLTPEHRVAVGATCCSTLKQAKHVSVGERVHIVSAAKGGGGGSLTTTTVLAKSSTAATGLHSPVLLHGGHPIVDGHVTAFDSLEKVTLAKYGLDALLKSCKATGTCTALRKLFFGADAQYLDAE